MEALGTAAMEKRAIMTEQVEDLIGWRRSDALRALVGARRLQQMVMSRQKVSGVMH